MLGYLQVHFSQTNKEKPKVFVEFPDDEATFSRGQEVFSRIESLTMTTAVEAIYGHFISRMVHRPGDGL